MLIRGLFALLCCPLAAPSPPYSCRKEPRCGAPEARRADETVTEIAIIPWMYYRA